MARVIGSACTALVMTGFIGAGAPWLHAQSAPSVHPTPDVDIDRYLGRWYELARYPDRAERRCTANVVVHYTPRVDGSLDVRNTCTTAEGAIEARGVARRAADHGPVSKLEVRFAPAIFSFVPGAWEDHWILYVAPDYSAAVIGTPDRKMLWLLARTPDVDMPTFARLVDAARAQGYDVDRLERTQHDVR